MKITIEQEKQMNKYIQVAVLTNMMNVAMGPSTKDMSPTVRTEMMHKKMDDTCKEATQNIKEFLAKDDSPIMTAVENLMKADAKISTASEDTTYHISKEPHLSASDILLKEYTSNLTPEKAADKVIAELGFRDFSSFKRVMERIKESRLKPVVVARVGL